MGVNIEKVFGENVFDDAVMKVRLPKSDYETVKKLMYEGGEITEDLADVVAQAMKEWALEKGATHFTHVFQPYVISVGAEKHDSFASVPIDGKIENTFTGKDLLMGEPDASSFPSGGLRATCGARGYTAWDITSPVYVKEDTLCIPTAFCSYTGESLDTKTPLLKAMHAVSKQGVRLMRLFGDQDTKRIFSYVGPEQEYFLVDREKYLKRPDLMYSGRTLFGAMPPKGQEMDDHYFGAIKPRVKAFMEDINVQLWKLGITAKTEHNEVAPAQHEIAPIFSISNVALDNNLLVMDVLKKTATKHGLVCLLHEKPFDGINGSGKHNNWSLTTDDGINLFKPGKKPEENKLFQLVLACTMAAVDRHAVLLRLAASNTGNDHRLGANEAPPAIISSFLGTQLSKVLEHLEKSEPEDLMLAGKQGMKLDIARIPELLIDNTDRNRTSPFAFTGNRFEFRAVGSEANCASAMLALNAAVAEQLKTFKTEVDAKIADGKETFAAILEVLRKDIKECKAIHFDGNGYSDEWKAEAARRGLDCETSVPVIFDNYLKESSVRMFESTGVMTRKELEARNEVKWETYTKKIQIEARVLGDLAMNHIIPTATRYQTSLIDNVYKMKDLFPADKASALSSRNLEIIEDIANRTNFIKEKVDEMVEARKVANKIESEREKAIAYHDKIVPMLEAIRYHIDKLELVVDDQIWTLPKYRELLFIR